MSAAGALIDMTAECGGATACNGKQNLKMSLASHCRLRSMKAVPALRTKSATSTSGRLIYLSGDPPFSTSESRGLAVACR